MSKYFLQLLQFDNKHLRTGKCFIFLLFITSMHLFYFFEDSLIPKGDGNRILPFVEFYHFKSVFYPLWNELSAGGFPVVASAERFVWLAMLMGSPDNIMLYNMLYVLGSALCAGTLFLLLRSLCLGVLPSLFGSLMYVGSQHFFNMLKSGRIEPLYSIALIFLTTYMLRRWYLSSKIQFLCFSAITLGIILIALGYYAAVYFFPFCILAFVSKEAGCIVLNRAIAGLLVVGFGGLAIASFWLLPLIQYMEIAQPVGPITKLVDDQPILKSIINVYLPHLLDFEQTRRISFFYFVSPLLVPLVIAYFLTRKHLNWKFEKAGFVIFVFGLFFCLGEIESVKKSIESLTAIPIISNIRWNTPFQWNLQLALILFSCAGLTGMLKHWDQVGKSAKIIAGVVTLICFLPVFGIQEFPENFANLKHGQTIFLSVIMMICALCILPFFLINTISKIACLSLVLMLQLSVFKSFQDFGLIPPKKYPTQYIEVLNNNEQYFRTHMRPNHLGLPSNRNFLGFSMYSSKEHRIAQSMLYDKEEITVGRPHWVKVPKLKNWDSSALHMLNIRYVEVKKHQVTPELLDEWVIAAQNKSYVLLRDKSWKTSLQVHPTWINVKGIEEFHKKRSRLGLQNKLFIEGADDIQVVDRIEQNTKGMSKSIVNFYGEGRLQVSNNVSGFLFVPEYYDKHFNAKVNGVLQKIYRANGCCRAIYLESGQHEVEFIYHNTLLKTGAWVSLISVIVAFLLGSYFTLTSTGRKVAPPPTL